MASDGSLQGIKPHLFQGIAWSLHYHSHFCDMPPPIPINVEAGMMSVLGGVTSGTQ